jgi:O-antigen/teichoic acid export membrane protein
LYVTFGQHLSSGLADAASLGPWLVALTVFWIWGQVLDQLPTVDERVRWQVFVLITLSLLRAIGTVVAAWVTRDVRWVVVALVVLSIVKVILLQVYLWRFHRQSEGPLLSWNRMREHAGQALPMGTGGLLFHMRIRAEQWLAAMLFTPTQYAAFSVASVAAPLIMVARKSVSFVMLPSMSREHSAGNIKQVLAINNRVNMIIASMLFPVLAYVLFFARPLVELVYTRHMIDAVPVMQLLVLTWALQTVDLNGLTLLLGQGRFTSRVNLVMLALAVPLSWWGAHHLGMPGVVIGSTVAIYLERILLIRRLSRELGVRPRHLQHWGLLAGVAASALFCGALAYGAVTLLDIQKPLWVLLTAALVGGLCYAPVLLSLRSRGLLFAPVTTFGETSKLGIFNEPV